MPARAAPGAGHQRQNFLERLPRHRDLGHLAGHVAPVADHLGVSDRLQSADFRTFPDRALERRGSTRSSRYRQPRFGRWRPYLTVLHQLSLRMRDNCGGMILPSVVRTMNKTPDRLYSDPRPIGFGAERRGPRRHTPSDSHSGWRLATIS